MQIQELNKEQQKAVNHIDGPMLVLAGAGSGKTKVLTNRIANLIENGISPYNILAITFTNKDEKEMNKVKIEKLKAEAKSLLEGGGLGASIEEKLRNYLGGEKE